MSTPEISPEPRSPGPMPPAHANGEGGSALYSVAILAGLVILLAASIGQTVDEPEAAPSTAAHLPRLGSGEPLAVESLACFTCHSLDTYANGGDGAFPHLDHYEFLEIEGCHLCHAFSNHDVVINRVPCADCH